MKKVLVFLILSAFYAFANAQVKDVQLWTGPTVKYNITKRLKVDFEQEFRFNENISHYNFTFSEFGIKYEILKYLDVKASFRQTFIPADLTGTALNDNDKSRLSLDASSSVKIFKTGLKAEYRFRYQNSWENASTVSSHYLRNRIGLDYNLSKRVDPYINWENYFRLDNLNEFRQNRYTIGLSWRVTKKLDLDSYIRYQGERNVKNPETDYIIGIGLKYSIN